MLGIGFEEMAIDKNGIKEIKLKVFLQYPQDYKPYSLSCLRGSKGA